MQVCKYASSAHILVTHQVKCMHIDETAYALIAGFFQDVQAPWKRHDK